MFDILNKCFGGCPRCKKHLSLIPMLEGYPPDVLSKEAQAEGGFDKSLIRLFHSGGGLKALLNLPPGINSRGDNWIF